jgi:hypothetical protein
MVKIAGQLKGSSLKARMILQIHDELVFELPNTELGELVKIAKECMENVLELKVPVRVDIKKGDNWLEWSRYYENTFAASEVVGFAKTGGLADVAGALPLALEDLGTKWSLLCLSINASRMRR